VHKALAHLVDQGFVGPIQSQDLPGQAKACLAEGRIEEAIQLLEKAIQEGVSPAACHSAAATAYERLGERAASCYHQRCFAEKLMEAGRIKEAAEILAHVRDVIPTDLSVRERLVELVSGPKAVQLAGFDPVAEGKLLVDLLVEMGETDRARDTIERLLVGRASDLELKKTLIGVYSGAGDTKRVLELYESIANDLVLRNDLIEAVKYLQKVLLFDRGRKDISDRIRQLYVLDERKRIRKRGLTYATLALLLMGALGGAYYAYESHVRAAFQMLPEKADALIASKDHAAALAIYEEFMATYSLSLTAREARGEIARIAALKSQHEEELERQSIRAEAEREKIRSEYRAVWGRYQEIGKREQDPESSLKLLERVDWLVKSTGSAEDLTWAAEVKLQEIRASLTEHIAGAWTLARKARQALEEGKPKDAYAMVMSLHERYGLTSIARSTAIPFLVESKPNGAAVFAEGRPVLVAGSDPAAPAVTPVILELLPPQTKTVRLQLAGHESVEVVLAADSPFPLVVTLPVTPAVSMDLARPLAGPYAIAHGIGVLSNRSEVLVVDVPSGRQRFGIRLNGLAEVAVRPIVSPERITFLTTDARIASLLTKDGSTSWSRQLRAHSKPLLTESDGYLYVCEDDGSVLCLDARTGRELWKARITSPAATPPAVLAKSVILVTQDHRLVVLRSDDGAFRLDQKLEGAPICPPLPAGDGVLLLLEGGSLVFQAIGTKQTGWSRELQAGVRGATMCLAGPSVLIVTDDGRVAKRSLADGGEEAVRKLDGKLGGGGLVINGGSAYVLTRSPDGKSSFLQAMHLTDLSFRWEHPLDGEPTGQLVSSEGSVFVVTDRGKVLGFQ
jgi:outer membrane protein assembly factor BamB/tetratricopeptide (TPR) repeat protein